MEKELLNLPVEELLEVQQIIMKIVRQKIRNQKKDEWKKILWKFQNGLI